MKKVNMLLTQSSVVSGLWFNISYDSIRMEPLLHRIVPCKTGVLVPTDRRINVHCGIARMM